MLYFTARCGCPRLHYCHQGRESAQVVRHCQNLLSINKYCTNLLDSCPTSPISTRHVFKPRQHDGTAYGYDMVRFAIKQAQSDTAMVLSHVLSTRFWAEYYIQYIFLHFQGPDSSLEQIARPWGPEHQQCSLGKSWRVQALSTGSSPGRPVRCHL